MHRHRAVAAGLDNETFFHQPGALESSGRAIAIKMHEVSFDDALEQIRTADPRFPRDAYLFVREALDHAQGTIAKDGRGRPRHISGQELLEGIREFALAQFGPMAMTVLEEWGIHCCRDFGDIVFNMVDNGLLSKTEKDSRADFEGGYDFAEAFRKPFLPASKAASLPRAKEQSPKIII